MNILFRLLCKVRILMQLIVFIVLLSFLNVYSQNSQPINHGFHDAIVFGMDGGLTLPQTDYQNNKTGGCVVDAFWVRMYREWK